MMPRGSPGRSTSGAKLHHPTVHEGRETEKDARSHPILVPSFPAHLLAASLLWKEHQVPSLVFNWKGAL